MQQPCQAMTEKKQKDIGSGHEDTDGLFYTNGLLGEEKTDTE